MWPWPKYSGRKRLKASEPVIHSRCLEVVVWGYVRQVHFRKDAYVESYIGEATTGKPALENI